MATFEILCGLIGTILAADREKDGLGNLQNYFLLSEQLNHHFNISFYFSNREHIISRMAPDMWESITRT